MNSKGKVELLIRAYRGEEDTVAIGGLFDAAARVDGPESAQTEDDLRRSFASPALNPRENVFLFESDGKPVAYGRILVEEGSDTSVFRIGGLVHPAWRRRGIGTRVVERLEERARHRLAELKNEKVLIGAEPNLEHPGRLALFRSMGYQEARFFLDMERRLHLDGSPLELAKPEFPPGMVLHSLAEESSLRATWEAAEDAFRDHWEHTDFTFEQFRHWIDSDPHFRPERWLYAQHRATKDVAGVCFNGIDPEQNARIRREEGWVLALAVRRPYRGHGLGRALLLSGLELLQREGVEWAMLTVDAENLTGALRLYEGAGFQPTKKYLAFRKPLREEGGHPAA